MSLRVVDITQNLSKLRCEMIIWILILMIIAFSLLSGEFAENTQEFFLDHALAILLVSLGLLYWYYRTKTRDR